MARPIPVSNEHFLNRALKNISTLPEVEKSLDIERFVLVRFIYKGTNQFRMQKRLQDMKKLDRAMKRFRDMGIVEYLTKAMEVFQGRLNSLISGCATDGSLYLPSKQMIEYFLAR